MCPGYPFSSTARRLDPRRRPMTIWSAPLGMGLCSAGEPIAQEFFASFAALAALALGAAEELGELAVAVALGVLGVFLHAQGVAVTLLGEPQQVVVLCLGTGDLACLGLCGHRGSPSVGGHTVLYPREVFGWPAGMRDVRCQTSPP